jgi:hypothetical protein
MFLTATTTTTCQCFLILLRSAFLLLRSGSILLRSGSIGEIYVVNSQFILTTTELKK